MAKKKSKKKLRKLEVNSVQAALEIESEAMRNGS